MKVGDTVYLVSDDIRLNPVTTTIKSIGKKYIHVELHREYSRFDIATRRSTNDSGSKYTLYESKEAYKTCIEEAANRQKLISIITDKINKASTRELTYMLHYIHKSMDL